MDAGDGSRFLKVGCLILGTRSVPNSLINNYYCTESGPKGGGGGQLLPMTPTHNTPDTHTHPPLG